MTPGATRVLVPTVGVAAVSEKKPGAVRSLLAMKKRNDEKQRSCDLPKPHIDPGIDTCTARRRGRCVHPVHRGCPS
jgi:hypothetical protein